MYEPKFAYSDKLVSQLIRLEGLKTKIHDVDLSYNVKHKLGFYAKSLDMFHVGHLIGLEMTLKDGEKLAGGMKLDHIKDNNAYLLNNFRNALEFNRSNIADTYNELDFTILLHLNKLIITSWRESWDARFRNVSDNLNETDNWSQVRDASIEPAQIQNEMLSLVEWYKGASPSMTPVVRIAIVLYRLFEVYPFFTGNLFSILSLADYLLIKNGLSGKVYSSFVRDFDTNEQKYFEAYQMSKKNFDLTVWIENFVTNLIKDLTEVKENMNEYIIDEEKSKKQPFLI